MWPSMSVDESLLIILWWNLNAKANLIAIQLIGRVVGTLKITNDKLIVAIAKVRRSPKSYHKCL